MSNTTDKISGTLKQGVGKATDDKDMQREGKAEELRGKLKDAVDSAKDSISEKVDDLRK